MMNSCTYIPHILLPRRGIDLHKWAVIACDQYTSQPEYWEETEKIVGEAPSTLRLVLPEAYLEGGDVVSRVSRIHDAMREYLDMGIMEALPRGVVLTERWSGGTCPRKGVILAFDLEKYDYALDSRSLIRPTERTVVERIPPRLKAREGALIELPHIMLLIDDPERKVIEPLFEKVQLFEKVYDTDLMQGGGHISGWFVPEGGDTRKLESGLAALAGRDEFNIKYGCGDDKPPLAYAVGDGNHSMATAKAHWEKLKSGMSEEERKTHPARYVLAEVVNINDESLVIHPIHRVVFEADAEGLIQFLTIFYKSQGCRAYLADRASECAGTYKYPFFSGTLNGYFIIENPRWAVPAAAIQSGLDAYVELHPEAKLDYIHGAEVVKSLAGERRVGFILPEISKKDIFRGVVYDGVLPRKTFSMGEANEKRYYMEGRSIVKL